MAGACNRDPTDPLDPDSDGDGIIDGSDPDILSDLLDTLPGTCDARWTAAGRRRAATTGIVDCPAQIAVRALIDTMITNLGG